MGAHFSSASPKRAERSDGLRAARDGVGGLATPLSLRGLR
jgi:hypothetical protein